MSSWSREPDDWFKRFAGGRGWFGSGGRRGFFSEFEEMCREMERMFEETIQNTERLPKDLVREYQSSIGGKVREVGPIVYGYSITVGPDGKPHIREFWNVRPSFGATGGMLQLTSEREPLADIVTTDKEVKVVVEMPGISKEDIVINAYENQMEISTSEKAERKYRKVIDLPADADIEPGKSGYKNGIFEIIFSKKAKPKGKEIRID
ncbi:MAG: archaeal heat shock protein Hsp20 [Thermoproteota archaeon]